jgi:ribonuclease HI
MQQEETQIVDFGCSESTNNRMELMAVVRVLWWIRESEPWQSVQRVQIFTDSKYVKDSIPRAQTWKSQKWRNRHGQPIENSDLWKQFLAVRRKVRVRVDFGWVPGKTEPILKRVDSDSKRAARRGGADVDDGYRRWKVGRSRVSGGSAKAFDSQREFAVIFVYRKDSPIKGENRLRFNLFLEQTQAYSGKYYACASDDLTHELHLQHAYRVRFGQNISDPRILEVLEEVPVPKSR